MRPPSSQAELCTPPSPGATPASSALPGILLIVCLSVLLVHLPALWTRARFADDDQYIFGNVLVQNPSWHNAGQFFREVWKPSTVWGYYQPVTMVSLMLDTALGARGESLVIFHGTSLLLHIGNAALIGILVHQLFRNVWAAAAAALFFGLHPMTVDSICWLSERKTLLATCFSLASLISYVGFARKHGWGFLLLSLVTYVMAVLSKPTALPLPAVMLLLDHWPLASLRWRRLLEKGPLFVAGAALGMIAVVSQSQSASAAVPTGSVLARMPLTVCYNVVFYIRKILWPLHLSPYYYVEPGWIQTFHPELLLYALLVLALVVAAFVSLRWTRALIVGCATFLVLLFPATGVIKFTDVLVANRYVYLPFLGVLLLLGASVAKLLAHGQASGPTKRTRCLAVIGVVLVLAESTATRCYISHWMDTVRLHRHMLTVTPDAPALHNDLGNALLMDGKIEEARRSFQRALRLAPWFPLARCNLAQLLLSEGKTEQAIEHCLFVVQAFPDFPHTYYILGAIYQSQKEYTKAIECLTVGLGLTPYSLEQRRSLARALASAQRAAEAITQLRTILRQSPTHVPAMIDLARLLATHPDAQLRRPIEAVEIAQRAAKIMRNNSFLVLDTLGAAYASNGRFSEAVETTQRALAIAKRAQNSGEFERIRQRLALYQANRPYIECMSDNTRDLVQRDAVTGSQRRPSPVPQRSPYEPDLHQ